jgi:hypothetical protein
MNKNIFEISYFDLTEKKKKEIRAAMGTGMHKLFPIHVAKADKSVQDIVDRLKDLAGDRQSFFNDEGDDEIFRDDYEALMAAVKLLTVGSGEMKAADNGSQASRIEIDTAFGKLFAELGGNPEYPEIYICIEQEAILPDSFTEKYERQLVTVEYKSDLQKPNKKTISAYVWADEENAGPTNEFEFMAYTLPEEQKEETL